MWMAVGSLSDNRILLVRHGECEDALAFPTAHPRADSPLTARGREQAAVLAKSLPPVVAVIASPLRRARETANIIAGVHELGLPITVDGLAEWRAPSAVTARPPAEWPDGYRDWQRTRTLEVHSRFEDGESLSELYDRALAVREHLGQVEARGRLLVVGHKVILTVLMHLGLGAGKAFTAAGMDHWENCDVRELKV